MVSKRRAALVRGAGSARPGRRSRPAPGSARTRCGSTSRPRGDDPEPPEAGPGGPRNPRRRACACGRLRGRRIAPHLAADAGIAPDTLRVSLVARGVATRAYRRRAREIFEARGAGLIAAYEAGASLGAVAAEAGVSELTLKRFLVARGVAIDDPRRRRLRGVLDARGAELIAAYEAGTPLARLADDAGIAPRTLRRFMDAEEVRLRDDCGRSGVKRYG